MFGIWRRNGLLSSNDGTSLLTSPLWPQRARLEPGNLDCQLRILFTYFQCFMRATYGCGVSGISKEESYKSLPIQTAAEGCVYSNAP